MSDKNNITLKWPLIDGILLKSDTTYLGPDNDKAMYINEIYELPNGQNTKVIKGVYPNGYRFIDMIIGNKTFTLGYRPDGSINYTVTSEDIKQDQLGPRLNNKNIPKGLTGMEIKRALNILNPFTWPARIKASLPKDAPEGTEFPAIIVDKKSQTLRYYDENGKQQLSSIVSTGANEGDITTKAESKTPEGNLKIGSKVDNVKEGVFGDNLFMGLSGTSNSGFKVNGRGFGIHGDANRPFQLGRCDSHGCVRVENKNLEELYNLAQSGTNVYIRKKGGNMKLIPKGAKGWYASEMQTWSPEKINQVLLQYGKDGLTLNTYNYLIKRVTPQNKPISLVLTAILQTKDLTNLPDAGLMFLATSMGIPNAYGMTSNEQLQNAISKLETINNRESAVYSQKQIQQSKLEDLWARRNYKVRTGKDWHAGIDLSDYTMEATRKLQLLLGVEDDGKWGVNSQKAYDDYLKKLNTNTAINDVVENTEQNINNYWDLVKDDPNFAQWLYTSGGKGAGRRVGNLINVAGNYISGMINPKGDTAFNLGQGLQRQAVGAALYNKQHGKTGITDSAHNALGGLGDARHSGDEFRLNTGIMGYVQLAMNSPYHNVYGQSADARFTDKGFESVGDGYTYNNVWSGKNAKGLDKVIKVLEDGEGTASLSESILAYKDSRNSGNSIKSAMETAASLRGVNTTRNDKVSFIPQSLLEDWAKEYYLANNSAVISKLGGLLKYISKNEIK